MKKWTWVLLIISFTMMLAGCTKEAVIEVGTPFEDDGGSGVNIHTEITDAKMVERLRDIMAEAKEIDEPEDFDKDSQLFFSLNRPKEGVAEIMRHVYLQNDGQSILTIEGYEGPESYFTLDEKQTNELKDILQ